MAIQLVVENLAPTTTESDLVALISGVSRLRDLRITTDRSTGEPQTVAHLAMASAAGAERVLQRFDGYELEGATLHVRPADGGRPLGRGGKDGLWGAGHAGSRPKGSRRGARARKRAL